MAPAASPRAPRAFRIDFRVTMNSLCARSRFTGFQHFRAPERIVLVCPGRVVRRAIWRRGWDSNPRDGFPPTRFPSVRLQPLGHPSVRDCAKAAHYSRRPAPRNRPTRSTAALGRGPQGARQTAPRGCSDRLQAHGLLMQPRDTYLRKPVLFWDSRSKRSRKPYPSGRTDWEMGFARRVWPGLLVKRSPTAR
jgi:hypothetical protein